MVPPIPKEVQDGRWLWPKDSSEEMRRDIAHTLGRTQTPPAFSALRECISIEREPEKDVRVACAEGLLKLDPKKAVHALWATHKTARVESKEPYLQWEGLLVGLLLVHGVQYQDKALIRSAEHFLYGGSWRNTIVRSSTFGYIMRHPHFRLEKYAVMGLRWDPMTRSTTAFLLSLWPYSRALVTAMVDAYDVSHSKEFLVMAWGRMKAKDRDVLNLLYRDLGLVPGEPAMPDDELREKIAEVLVFDLQDRAGLAIVTSIILKSDDNRPVRRTLFVRRLGLQKTDWALKALLDFATQLANGELRYEVALSLHRNFPDDPRVATMIRPIFEAALKDKTASPYILKECGARLSQLQ